MTPTPTETTLLDLLMQRQRGVLVTVKRDGRPQLSNIDYAHDDVARVIRISSTDGRAKVRNLRRDPRASLYVTTDDMGAYAVAEAIVELSPVAGDPHDATVEELIDVYRAVQGEHPDWDDYRAAMVADRRLVVRLNVQRVYGWAPAAPSGGGAASR
jgi:PPOX class probable F420-dependent enzyme